MMAIIHMWLTFLSATLMISGTSCIQCYWCSEVGRDRDCELHPHFHLRGPRKSVNCSSEFCLAAKVIDSETGTVKSFARLCDNIDRGNSCFRDTKLLTCYQSCSTDLCNKGNPDPAYLDVISYITALTSDSLFGNKGSSRHSDPDIKQSPRHPIQTSTENPLIKLIKQKTKDGTNGSPKTKFEDNSLKRNLSSQLDDLHLDSKYTRGLVTAYRHRQTLGKSVNWIRSVQDMRKIEDNSSSISMENHLMKVQPSLKDVTLYKDTDDDKDLSNRTHSDRTTDVHGDNASRTNSNVSQRKLPTFSVKNVTNIEDFISRIAQNISMLKSERFKGNSTSESFLQTSDNSTMYSDESMKDVNGTELELTPNGSEQKRNNSENGSELLTWIEVQFTRSNESSMANISGDTKRLKETAPNRTLAVDTVTKSTVINNGDIVGVGDHTGDTSDLKPVARDNTTVVGVVSGGIQRASAETTQVIQRSETEASQQDLLLADTIFLPDDTDDLRNEEEKEDEINEQNGSVVGKEQNKEGENEEEKQQKEIPVIGTTEAVGYTSNGVPTSSIKNLVFFIVCVWSGILSALLLF